MWVCGIFVTYCFSPARSPPPPPPLPYLSNLDRPVVQKVKSNHSYFNPARSSIVTASVTFPIHRSLPCTSTSFYSNKKSTQSIQPMNRSTEPINESTQSKQSQSTNQPSQPAISSDSGIRIQHRQKYSRVVPVEVLRSIMNPGCNDCYHRTRSNQNAPAHNKTQGTHITKRTAQQQIQ